MSEEITPLDIDPGPSEPERPATELPPSESVADAPADPFARLKRLGASLGAAVKAAAATPEAESLKSSVKGAADQASQEVGQVAAAAGDKVRAAESTDSGQKLKQGAAGLLAGAGSLLNRAAAAVEVPAADTVAGASPAPVETHAAEAEAVTGDETEALE